MVKKLLFVMFLLSLVAKAQLLDIKDAFKVGLSEDESSFGIHFSFGDQIYIYKQTFSVLLDGKNINDEVGIPEGENKGDYTIIHDEFSLSLPYDNIKTNSAILKLNYQGCSAEGICYRPQVKEYKLEHTSSGWNHEEIDPNNKNNENPIKNELNNLSEEQGIALQISNSSFFISLITFFGYGLLLSLTPCVLPMVPILSGIIVSKGSGKGGFLLSLVYVLAMSFTYSVFGVAISFLGGGVQASLQNIYVLGAFAVIFIVLSLSMFGFYDINISSKFTNKLTDKAGKGYIGVAIMGLLSALVVSPCVAAPLAGALLYIASSGNAVYGGIMLFAMGIGMGVPLLIIGASAKKILPRPGAWMEAIKATFGFMMLAMAVWLLSRIFGYSFALIGYGALGIYFVVYFGIFGPVNTTLDKFKKGTLAVIGIYSVILFSGGIAGAKDIADPLLPFRGGAVTSADELNFKKVHNLKELKDFIANAKKPVMVDFWASWCVSCLELDHITFSNPDVISRLSEFELVKVDMSNTDDGISQLVDEFGVVGPPVLLFFDNSGQELRNLRVVGFLNPADFLKRIEGI